MITPSRSISIADGDVSASITAPTGALRVTFLDVGQGDTALIELPDGAVIEAGGNPGAHDLAQAAAPRCAIDRVLAAYDHTWIALAIVSHPHPDHDLGLPRSRRRSTSCGRPRTPAHRRAIAPRRQRRATARCLGSPRSR